MEQVKKKLISMGQSWTATIVMLCIAAVIAVIAVIVGNPEYTMFEGYQKGNVALYVQAYYGPFAVAEQNGKTVESCYLAWTEDHKMYAVATRNTGDIPVYRGEDFLGADEENVYIVLGKGKAMPHQMQTLFHAYTVDVPEVFHSAGFYYLDATDTPTNDMIAILMFAIGAAGVAVILFFVGLNQRNKIKTRLQMLEQQGIMAPIYQDLSYGNPRFVKGLKAVVGSRYILDFSQRKIGFQMIELANINNVFKCRMVNGQPTVESYLALENDNGRYLMARCAGGTAERELDDIIMQLKGRIGGGYLR